MNTFLTYHVYKVFKVPGWLLSIKLLFKNKLSVLILGLYAGASLAVYFTQANNINSMIARAVNELLFVVLGSNFNEDGSQKCASFKKCLDFGLVNSLDGCSNSIAKTINFLFISSNLVNAVMDWGVSNVGEFFDTNYQAVFVFVSLGGLLNIWLNSFHKQANRDCWKFEFKSANKTKWNNFKDVMSANAVMFLNKFVISTKFSHLDVMWNIFKSFDDVFTKESSKFHKLELLVSRIVKASHEESFVNFDSLIRCWISLDNNVMDSSAGFDHIHSALFGAKKSYSSFSQVSLNHLVVDNELILKSDLIKFKMDVIMESWTKKHKVYVFDKAFSGVMSSIRFDELVEVVSNLLNGKAAGLSVKHQKSVCGYRLNFYFIFKTGHAESQAGLSSFFATGTFVDDTIWVGSNQRATQHILDIATDIVCILLDCNLSLSGFLANSFQFHDGMLISVVLDKSNSSLNILGSDDFVSICDYLSWVDAGVLFVYVNRSLKNLDTASCRADAAIFFEDIGLGLGVGVLSLMSSTLTELQVIALALKCVFSSSFVHLFSDSQSALDACKSELGLMCPNFCNQCWIEH
ncbi:hypothetical protein G9A89_009987 [Geosiphon pyriformis]|nr:hypothetical protein G9A89_009987 [Geosiphon pyriformis]